MKLRTLWLVLSVFAAATASAPTWAGIKTIQLPADGIQLKASELPGFAKAQAQCVVCHSAEYMAYQPPNAPRAYWDAMVKRMKAVFKAPVVDDDMPAIVDYLVKTYGNEQTK
jgi:mono/diheme cytochrome c family protein